MWVESIKEKFIAAGYTNANDNHLLICLERDEYLIYDAIKHMGIDLNKEDVSIDVFLALLKHVPEKTELARVVFQRIRERDSVKNKKSYKLCRQLQQKRRKL